GIDGSGGWTPAFPGQRPPFAAGNDLAVRHGGYVSGLRLQGRASEIFESLKPHVPGYCEAFAPMLTICATLLARSEVALAAIAKLDEAAVSPLTPYTIDDAAK